LAAHSGRKKKLAANSEGKSMTDSTSGKKLDWQHILGKKT
jgi:hypothetical protein